MNNESNSKKKTTLGIFAHVDAGKTTLAEAMLFLSGKIKTLGRVDHKDTYLDTYELEKKRGITIFSKIARFSLPKTDVTLIDTPGHVDFAEEAERTLCILDAAILVVSGTNLVESHTLTLWSLLRRYRIPVFVFVNKMDISTHSHKEILSNLSTKLDGHFADFSQPDAEEISLASDELMNSYLETGVIPEDLIKSAITKKELFPVYFGSALKLTEIETLLAGLDRFLPGFESTALSSFNTSNDFIENPSSESSFSAKVFKITRDTMGTRLTHVKILRGSVKVKSEINNEKINQIRLISGEKYDTLEEAVAGDICAFTGLKDTFASQVIGTEGTKTEPFLSPVMSCKLILPPGCDVFNTYKRLSDIAEELPEISLTYLEETSEIQVQIMGEVQMEILKHIVKSRLNIDIDFGKGSIIYKETVSQISEGIGHFEPLRHYAEVHIKIEPGERGSGIIVDTDVSEDLLDKNWQRLIVTHLLEKRHRGVLTGSSLTDVKLTVVGGRAHPKHTEGGDFRQATYRAVRCGLMRNVSVLLEPYYDFELNIPASALGRAMTDIKRLCGTIRSHEINGNLAKIYGSCPVSTMHGYALDVTAYTKGEGTLILSSGGFNICHNPEEIIEERNYNVSQDLRNTPDSVFCANGSGFIVPWEEVENYMHVPLSISSKGSFNQNSYMTPITPKESSPALPPEKYSYSQSVALDKELASIFNRTFQGGGTNSTQNDLFYKKGSARNSGPTVYSGASASDADLSSSTKEAFDKPSVTNKKEALNNIQKLPEYLLVDGYNIIFSNERLSELAATNLEAARQALTEQLCNYKGYTDYRIILVFDAYKVSGGIEKTEEQNGIYVVFTKEAEIADRYIERTTKELVKKANVTVATSDATEQIIIWSAGALRMSAKELWKAMENTNHEISSHLNSTQKPGGSTFFDSLSAKDKEKINKKRLE